ncbi:hypothetical protein G6011_04685, partial [Alternaria panax]
MAALRFAAGDPDSATMLAKKPFACTASSHEPWPPVPVYEPTTA